MAKFTASIVITIMFSISIIMTNDKVSTGIIWVVILLINIWNQLIIINENIENKNN